MIALVRRCFQFREFLVAFVARDIRGRYIGSILGGAWAVLQPLAFLSVYYLVFIEILNMDEGMVRGKGWAVPATVDSRTVAAFLMFCAIVPWIHFTEAVSRMAGCIVENGNMIKKITFPSELLPVYIALASLVNMLVSFAVYAVLVLVFLGRLPECLWALPIVLLFHTLFVLGLGYFAAAANVFVRDVAQLLPLLLTFWFFLTPIFYTVEMLETDVSRSHLLWIFRANPLAYAMKLYRRIFIAFEDFRPEGSATLAADLSIFGAIAIVSFFLGYRFFMSRRPRFADEL